MIQDQNRLQKKNKVTNPRAASPPTIATIQRGTLPISLILSLYIKLLFINCLSSEKKFLVKKIA